MIGNLNILGVQYTVATADACSLPVDYQGLCDSNSATITLRARMAHDVERQVLLHEIIHAIDIALGMNLSEMQVSNIGAGLASIPQLAINIDAL